MPKTRRDFVKAALALTALAPLSRSRAGRAGNVAALNLKRTPYVDGLTFLTDNPQDLKDSGLTALILDCSAAAPLKTDDGKIKYFRSFEACARSITAARQRLRSEPGLFLGTRGSDVAEAFSSHRTAVFLQFQGCEPMGADLTRLDLFYELGLRILQITHHNNNPFGGGAIQKTWSGLTRLGTEAVERMNQLGIIPDLSHASDPTCLDVLKTSKKPVILSHGGARALVRNARCAPDDVIRGVGASGGVMGIFMMSFWLTTDPVPTIESFLRQVRHVINVAGIGAVGIANDYPVAGNQELAKINNNNEEGVKSYFPWWDSVASEGVLGFEERPRHAVIPELNNTQRLFTIHAALVKSGFKSRDVEKIMEATGYAF